MIKNRFERQIRFFGKEGQIILSNTHVCIVGVGGIGSHLAQQLAYLGIGSISLLDDDKLEETNLNRLIGAEHKNPVGKPKVDIIEQLINSINPEIKINKVYANLISKIGFATVKQSDFIFGCLDNDGARFILNEICLANEIPFIDSATDIISKTEYGGRVVSIIDEDSCLQCLGLISSEEVRRYLADPDIRKDEESIYGVNKELLDDRSPSVVTLNGIIASVAATEFFLNQTEIRKAKVYLKYHGNRGILTEVIDEPDNDCYWCKEIRGKHEKIDFNKYIIS